MLSPEEIKIVEFGKKNGKTQEQVLYALAQYRNEKPEQPMNTMGFMAAVNDLPQDAKQIFTGARDAVTAGIETAQQAREQVTNQEISPLAGTIKTIGGGLSAGARAIGGVALGAGKALLSPFREQQIANKVGEVAQNVMETEPAQFVMEKYNSLTPEEKAVVDGTLGTVEGLGAVLGASGASKLFGKAKEVANSIQEFNIPKLDLRQSALSQSISQTAKDVIPKSADLRDSSIAKAFKLAPSDITNIKSFTQNDIGEFMGRYNLIKNTPEETLEDLARFQQRNYDRVGDAVSLVDNSYTFNEIPEFKQILDFMEQELAKTTSRGFAQARQQIKAIKEGGEFSLSDMQQTKRMFDEITSFYKRSGDVKDSLKAEDMTRNMSNVREFISNEVKAQYPELDINILNNNVQTSRAILDAVVNRSGKTDTESLFKLGDMAVLGAGNVSAPYAGFAALVAKKVIESAPIRLRMAKKFDEIARKSMTEQGLTPKDLKDLDKMIQDELAKSLSSTDRKEILDFRTNLLSNDQK